MFLQLLYSLMSFDVLESCPEIPWLRLPDNCLGPCLPQGRAKSTHNINKWIG